MKKEFKKFMHEKNNNGLSTNDIWTIVRDGDTEIHYVYLKKEDANEAAKDKNREYYKYSRNINKLMPNEEFEKYFNDPRKLWAIKTLSDTIDLIREEIYKDVNY